jgi:AbrB family looped-hinge helix DNA binding protein
MAVQVKVDRQGRIVIPLSERERLGIAEGGMLELIPTREGLLLEPRTPAQVKTVKGGLRILVLEDGRTVSNEETLEAIHRVRDGE